MSNETLTKFNQENIICLLTFDAEHCLLVRNAISPDLFDGVYKKIVEKLVDYIDKYKIAPQEHIADELETQLASAEGDKYRDILTSIYSAKTNLNTEYVINKLTEFIQNRNFEIAMYDAAALHQQGKNTEAREILRKADTVNLSLFDPGIKVTDLSILAKSLSEEDILPTGIKALDDMGVGPGRKQILVYLGVRSSGKTWFATQCGRMAMMLNHKVAHISLEISKEQVLQRYIQNLLGLTRWHYNALKSPMFVRDGNGDIIRWDHAIIDPKCLEDANILEHVETRLNKFGPKLASNIRIKEFPPGMLSMSGLRTYLDGLERTENFIPDEIIIDMPRNMKLNIDNFRLSIGQLFIDLRGLGVERNAAIIAMHQVNREGDGAKFITGRHISEDWGILGTADTGLIYNQKPMEQKSKIARLYVDRGKSVRSQFTVLMAQNYDIGQYCLDSAKLPSYYDPAEGMETLSTAED